MARVEASAKVGIIEPPVIVTNSGAIVSRFAPAPTGYLHLGHVVNAIYVWGLTKAAGGRVLLRIEDHDRQRSRPEYERAILDDLEWLGFVPDEPSIARFRAGATQGRQSDRAEVYERALAMLRDRGLLYACECSRSTIAQAAAADRFRAEVSGNVRRQGVARGRRARHPCAPAVDHRTIRRPAARTAAAAAGRSMRRSAGPRPRRQLDLSVCRRRGRPRPGCHAGHPGRRPAARQPAGRFSWRACSVVLEPPRFLHHPLVMKSESQKLSKADRDSGIRDLRAKGWRPEAVIGHAAAVAGLVDVESRLRPKKCRDLAPFVRLARALTDERPVAQRLRLCQPAPAATPSRGPVNPRRGVSVSSRWGGAPAPVQKRLRPCRAEDM